MLISACEGDGRRFEVQENVDGFIVSQRDLSTGEEIVERLFRTAPAAFAFAEFSAAAESCAGDGLPDPSDQDALRRAQDRFRRMSERLADEGVPGALLDAWRREEKSQRCIRYH